MSVLKTSQVFRLALNMSEKFVLLKLADCADDNGRNAFPSVALLSASCGCNERTVRRALRRLEDLGLLEVASKATNRRPTVYRVRPERGQLDPWFAAPAETAAEDDQASQGGEICPPGQQSPEGTICPPNDEARIEPEKAAFSGGTNLPPKTDQAASGGTLTSARGGTVPPDPSKRDPSKIKTPADAIAPAASSAVRGAAHFTPDAPQPGETAPGVKTTSPVPIQTELLEEFDRAHRAAFKHPQSGEGVPLHITRGKDARNVLDLVRKDGAEEVRSRWRAFLQLRGDRLLDSSGYTVSTFLLRYAGLAAKARAPASRQTTDRPSKFAQVHRVSG